MGGKDVAGMAAALFPKADNVILTRSENSRSVDPDKLLEQFPPEMDTENIYVTASVSDALAKANEVTPPDGLILITGSLYLVGEAKKILNN